MAEQNPFKEGSAGENSFKAAYDRLKAESQQRMSGIQSQYGNLYSNLRNQQYAQGLGMAAQSGFSGGQAQGLRGRLGAEQIKALGGLAGQRQQAVLGENVNRSSIYSNALLEGQQAQQYEDEQNQSALIRQQTIDAIVNNKDLSTEEKERQLAAFGVDPQEAYNQSGQGERDTYGNIGGFSGILSMEIDDTRISLNRLEDRLTKATTVPLQNKLRQEIIDVIEKIISRLMSSAQSTGGSLTREQAINRLRRRGLPIDTYGIR
jgi:hypothetical protein